MLKRNIDYRLSLNSYCAYLAIGNSYKYIKYLNNIIYKENSATHCKNDKYMLKYVMKVMKWKH